MLALLDGDIIAYRCAASCKEDDDVSIALIRADKLIEQILNEVGAVDYRLYLGGSNNFRYAIYSDYKANRKDTIRPQHLQPTREFLVTEWSAQVTDGYETDDALGMDVKYDGIICSIDKDLLQVPGLHWNWVNEVEINVLPVDGLRTFYKQLLLGDRTDNIPGFDGKLRQKPTKFLEQLFTRLDEYDNEYDMYDLVQAYYDVEENPHLERNANLLYIWRELNDKWTFPVKPQEVDKT